MNALTACINVLIACKKALLVCTENSEVHITRERLDTHLRMRESRSAYAYLELRRTLRHTSTPDIYIYIYKQKNRASWTTRLARSRSPIIPLQQLVCRPTLKKCMVFA